MAQGSNITIRVAPEKLNASASEVEQKIQRVEKAFKSMEQIVNAGKSFWQGDGHDRYVKAFKEKNDIVQTALIRFRENATDLRQIAGVYTAAEKAVESNNSELKVDQIV